MSNFEQRDMSGVLFRNNRKEKDTHPDYNGTCMIDGSEYYMNAWLKESKNGNKFFSFSFKEKGEKHRQITERQQQMNQYSNDMDEDIPF